MIDRWNILQDLLDTGKFFKLVCGAGNEDYEEVKKLSFIYTLAGSKGIDISATPKIVKACNEGINLAFQFAKENYISLRLKPFITVSVGMPGDHHVRKANINEKTCIECNLCIPVCPTDAIPNKLIIIEDKCIGCGNCSAICPVNDVITYSHNKKDLNHILPKCLELGAENIELHASILEDNHIFDELALINKINPNNHNSVCLDRFHLSDFQLSERVKKAYEMVGKNLIIQADGIPMSGGENSFNSTLQAIATADLINKKFNMDLSKKTKKLKYKQKNNINILLSGGTNSLTSVLAIQNGVKFSGVSIGTYARNIIKHLINQNGFYQNKQTILESYKIAKKLINDSVGKIDY